MELEIVRYAGSYRFADRAALDAALARARGHIDDDTEQAALDGGWLRCFVARDTSLAVNLALPALPEHRFIAGAVFGILASDAIAGSVRATIADACVDEFISGEDDD